MPEVDHPSSTASAARRKLIRGAFAAPALMTVCSGSAFAVASHLRCLENAQNSPTPPAPWGSDVIDGYSRVQLVMVRETPASRTSSGSDTNTAEDKERVADATASGTHSPDMKDKPPKDPSDAAQPSGTPPVSERYFVRGDDPIFSRYRASSRFSSNSQWQEIDINTYQPLGTPVEPPNGTVKLVEKYVIVRYDADGVIVGFGAGTDGAMGSAACLFSAGIVPP